MIGLDKITAHTHSPKAAGAAHYRTMQAGRSSVIAGAHLVCQPETPLAYWYVLTADQEGGNHVPLLAYPRVDGRDGAVVVDALFVHDEIVSSNSVYRLGVGSLAAKNLTR